MADEINLDAGDDAENVIAGKGNQQSRQQANPSQSLRSGNNYYGGDNSQQWIIAQINDHAQQIRELTYRLDDLPMKVGELKIRVDTQAEKVSNQGDRVKRLEELEVIVRKDEVIIKPITPPESVIISTHTLSILLIVVGALFLGGLLYLVWLQVARGA